MHFKQKKTEGEFLPFLFLKLYVLKQKAKDHSGNDRLDERNDAPDDKADNSEDDRQQAKYRKNDYAKHERAFFACLNGIVEYGRFLCGSGILIVINRLDLQSCFRVTGTGIPEKRLYEASYALSALDEFADGQVDRLKE